MAFAVERFHCNFNTLTNNINKDFKKVNDRVTQWYMSFKPDSTKKFQEVIFYCNIKKPPDTQRSTLNHLTSTKQMSNKICLSKTSRLILDNQLSFEQHLKAIFSKVNKIIRLIRKLRDSLPTPSLATLYSLFDLILTIEKSFTISYSIFIFKTKFKLSNITHFLPSPVK